jgi:outer membrane lipoprotein
MFYNKMMKRLFYRAIVLTAILTVCSCAPVLRKDIMDAAIRNISPGDLQKNPEIYRGKLLVLGGIVINTKLTAEGSLIEALYVPVDSRGYLEEIGTSPGRIYALFPQESGILDPVIFRSDREITFAGEFAGLRQGKIDEMDYSFPLFIIRALYLWEERKFYYMPYYDYDPFFWGYPYWWRYYSPSPPPPYWW